MNKSILLSVRPEYVAMILNGEKIIEIRKKFPVNYKGWVYIYCTKIGWHLEYKQISRTLMEYDNSFEGFIVSRLRTESYDYNGKVVARFWCDKVEELSYDYLSDNQDGLVLHTELATKSLSNYYLRKWSCLSQKQLDGYIKFNDGYAIFITQLEIFNVPRDLFNFTCNFKNLDKAPLNYCYLDFIV